MKQILMIALLGGYLGSCESKQKTVKDKTNEEKHVFIPSPSDTADANNFCTGPGSRNFLVSEVEGEAMTKKFADVFKKGVNNTSLKGVNVSFWVDACSMKQLYKLLDSAKYDGVRIIFSAKDNSDKSTHFYFIPTTYISDTQHAEDWKYKIDVSNCVSKGYFDLTDAKNNIDRFETVYGERSSVDASVYARDSVSREAWIDICVIKSLSAILTRHSELVDGVNVLLAAYDKKYAGTGQKKDIQSTVILVPSEKDSHRSMWEIPEFFIRNKNLAGYNHSQLCPYICN